MRSQLNALPLVIAASSALAGPLDNAWIDPDASWAVHIDLEAAFTSQLARHLLAHEGVDLEEIEREFKAELTDLDFDEMEIDIPENVVEQWRNIDFSVLDDLRSITAYGLGEKEDPEVIIIQTTDAIDEIVASFDPIEGLDVAHGEHLSFVSLASIDDDPENEAVAAIKRDPLSENRTVIIGENVNKLVGVLDAAVRRGNAGGPDWAEASPGSFFFAHVTEEALGHMIENEHARMIGSAKSMRIDVGENAGLFYLNGAVETADAETVNQLYAIANGVMAMGRLALGGEPEGQQIIQLMDRVRLTTNGNTLSASFSIEVQALSDIVERLDAEHGEGADIEIEGSRIERHLDLAVRSHRHDIDLGHDEGHRIEIRIETGDEDISRQ